MEDFKSILFNSYTKNEQLLNGMSSSAIHDVRTSAHALLRDMDFPTLQHEEWKHTNLSSILSTAFHLESTPDSDTIANDFGSLPGAEKNVLVFLNGRYSPSRSHIEDKGIDALGLHEAYDTHRELIDTHIAQLVPTSVNAFVTSNTAYINDGAFIMIGEGVVVDHPIYILNIIDARREHTLVHPRNLFLLAKNSKCSVILRNVTLGDNKSLCNQVTECYVADSAHAEFTLLQDDTDNASVINTMQFNQARASVLNMVTVSLSGLLTRNDVGTRLSEQAAEAHMYGVFCTNGTSVVDNHTVMDHAVAHCHSNELFKGILDGQSQGVFNGKIYVRPDAQKTLAYQSNRNVLLSNTASINTKPQLEIFADDVKCSHGCTIGKLDEDALFYLQARGIGEQKARALLLTAFAEDVTEKISQQALRAFINDKIEERLQITI